MICIFTQKSFQRISVIFCFFVSDVLKIVSFFYNGFTLQWPFVNLGIGIGFRIETDIANAIISSSIRPMDTKICRVVT